MSRRTALLTVALVCLPLAGTAHATPTTPADPPGAMALVLDASGSMAEPVGGGGSRIDAAKESLRSVVDSLPADQQVSFRVYGSTDVAEDDPLACRDSERIVDLGADNRDDLRAAIDDYEPVGWTPTGHALREAAVDLGDEGQRTIVLVSDGESTCDPDPCEVAEELSGDGIELKIDVIGLDVDGAARDQLRCTAAAGNGTYYDVDSAAELTDSLSTSSTRAARPFDLTGTPVEGTETLADAPALGTGQFLDRLRGGEQVYRLPRTVPGTTLRVGLTLIGEGNSTGSGAGVSIAPIREDGTRGAPCDSTLAYNSSLGEARPVFYSSASSSSRPDAECSTADELVAVVREVAANQEQGTPFELVVYEEPPLADPTTPTTPTTEPPTDPTWESMEAAAPDDTVVPGTSLSSAPVIEDGTYALDITAGETQVFAVPVDWGQDVQAQLDAQLTEDVREAAAIGSRFAVSFIGPVRDDASLSLVGDEQPDDWTVGALGNLREPEFRTGAQTHTVAYGHRTSFGGQRGSSVAGLRYVAVTLAVRGNEANQPYTLTVRTNGTPGEGGPEYSEVDGLAAPRADSALVTASVAEADTSTEEPAADEATEDAAPWLLVAIAVVVAVGAVVAVVVLRRRRRTA